MCRDNTIDVIGKREIVQHYCYDRNCLSLGMLPENSIAPRQVVKPSAPSWIKSISGYSIVMVIPVGFEPEPSVWKTDMLGRYTNATHSGPLLSRVHSLTSRHH